MRLPWMDGMDGLRQAEGGEKIGYFGGGCRFGGVGGSCFIGGGVFSGVESRVRGFAGV